MAGCCDSGCVRRLIFVRLYRLRLAMLRHAAAGAVVDGRRTDQAVTVFERGQFDAAAHEVEDEPGLG